MRHLAQIQCQSQSNQPHLLLLAQEQPDGSWQVFEKGDRLCLDHDQEGFSEGTLVLLQLDPQRQITSIQDATDWLLHVVQHHFISGGITPEFVQQEREKIEAWRQEMTAQSQDFTRRQLELEVRRGQLEALEQRLNQP